MAKVTHYAPPHDLRRVADQLLVLLRQLGTEPNAGCELMRARKVVLDLATELGATGMTKGGDFGKRVDAILMVRQWARILTECIGSPLEAEFRKRVTVLTSGDPSLHHAAQRSLERDLAFEVSAASLVARAGKRVRFEEPPDLIIDLGGRTVGAACKAVYGTDVSRPLRKGRDQLAKAKCDGGVVLVQLTNRIQHKELFDCRDAAAQEYRVWTNEEDAQTVLERLVVGAAEPLTRVAKTLGGGAGLLGIVAIAESACFVTRIGITLLHQVYAIPAGGPGLPKAWGNMSRRNALLEIADVFSDALNKPRT